MFLDVLVEKNNGNSIKLGHYICHIPRNFFLKKFESKINKVT